jgi:hypothetical protein
MEVKTLGELLQNQQNQILSLTIHMNCLIEELDASGFLDSDKLDKRMKKKLKKLQAIADKLKENEEPLSHIFNYGGTIGEA